MPEWLISLTSYNLSALNSEARDNNNEAVDR